MIRATVLFALLAAAAAGQTTLHISGFADGYVTGNFNAPVSGRNQLYTFNTKSNTLAFNLAELKVAKAASAPGAWGFTVALGYGPAVRIVQAANPRTGEHALQDVLQAYGTYRFGHGLQLDFGRFATPLGAEVIETAGNWNYSRSLLFSYAIPFNHTGARATASVGSKWSVYGMVVNGWNSIGDNNSSKTVGAGVAFTPGPNLSMAENLISGNEDSGNRGALRTVADTIISVNPLPRVSFLGNYDFGEDKTGGTNRWQGIAAYIHYEVNSRIAITPRVEWYADPQGFTTGVAQHLREATVTLEYKAGVHALTRAEYRVDRSDHPYFSRGSAISSRHQATATVGLVLMF